MLPKRPETVSALAPGPEDADEHQERPDAVTNAAHTAILKVAGDPSRTARVSELRQTRTGSARVFRFIGHRVDPDVASVRASVPAIAFTTTPSPTPACPGRQPPVVSSAQFGDRRRHRDAVDAATATVALR